MPRRRSQEAALELCQEIEATWPSGEAHAGVPADPQASHSFAKLGKAKRKDKKSLKSLKENMKNVMKRSFLRRAANRPGAAWPGEDVQQPHASGHGTQRSKRCR